ncbi:MAG: nicotinate-nucleotide diphosphorylase (carboxylating) [Bdellovibrio sp.]|nr:MAG: nicotinate-nucleotide diphosphorylase (carboxylating) [Bdellovibrio sp.]
MNLTELIRAAIVEDLPHGDLTTESMGLTPKMGRARLLAKQDLILSGSPAFEEAILYLEPGAKLKWHFEEGHAVLNRQIICTVQGDLVQIVKAERVALNFMMRLSGIATLTGKFVQQVKGTRTAILDTRKTIPGYRDLEKKAVVHGGGKNHRRSLSEAILIKNNHITLARGIRPAVERIRVNTDQAIKVEVRTLEDVKECVKLRVQGILFDNMDNQTMSRALKLIPPEMKMEIEASGNMTLERVESVAKLGVANISIGALTHSAPAADLSLVFDGEGL